MSESESEVAQSCLTLCDSMDCNLPGSSIHGIFQARVLEWVAISSSRGSSQPRDWTQVSCIGGRHFAVWATRDVQIFEMSAAAVAANTYKTGMGRSAHGEINKEFPPECLSHFWPSLLFYNEDFPQQGIWVPRRFIPNSKNGCYWYFIVQYQKLHTILLLWGKTR